MPIPIVTRYLDTGDFFKPAANISTATLLADFSPEKLASSIRNFFKPAANISTVTRLADFPPEERASSMRNIFHPAGIAGVSPASSSAGRT